MPSVSLPEDASLEQLRKQAKDVRDLARAGVSGALDLVAEHHPKGAHPVTLIGAQLVVARHYGFASWARLRQYLGMIERYRRSPDEVDQVSGAAGEFLAFACLRFGGDDEPSRWERAAHVLAAHPQLTRSSIHVAAAAADEAAVRELAEWLVAHGAAPPALDEVNSLIAAVLAGDRDTVARLQAHAPVARERRPGLMAWAASGRKLDAIALLAELGFDVNARGRRPGPPDR